MSVLISIAGFLVAISILVTVHEFGHFWVARRMGVKVLRFSIGFGKPLYKRTGKDGTEYVIASIPLGGYVKMLGESDEAEITDENRHQAHNRASVYRRFAIAIAGPMFNFIFAIMAYWLLFVVGVQGIKPLIGEVVPDSPAAIAGIKSGDEIIDVNGNDSPIWDVVLQTLIPSLIDEKRVNLTLRDKNGYDREVQLDFNEPMDKIEPAEIFLKLGMRPWRPPIQPVIGVVQEDSPAALAGIRTGDRIVRINGMKITDWQDLVEQISTHPDTDMDVTVQRNNENLALVLHTRSIVRDGKTIGQMGVLPKEFGKIPDNMKVKYQYPVTISAIKAIENTWDKSVFTLRMIGKIITGEVSIKNLSGPINIAVYAGYSISSGWLRFLDFLAIISISLGVLNLLPIPMLDGGHLMYYLIEMVKGSPVSETAMDIGFRIGVVILVMLMSIAFYNDILRILN